MPFKLQNLGTANKALVYFESYLTNRQQSTRLATSLSEPLTITHGVPQGSILGPTLFSLYMNDLPEVIKCSNIESYINDTKIYFSFALKTIDSCLHHVAEDLKHVSEWCCANHLLINPEKTKFVLFGVRQLISKSVPSNIILNSLVFSKLFYYSTVWSGTS